MNTLMSRSLKAALLLAFAVGAITLAGCSAGEKKEVEMKMPEVWGYVAGERFAKLDVDDQPGANPLVVERVLSPGDAWIVVHLDDNGAPGDRVGLKHVSKGENLDVEVPLAGVTTEKVIVAVHADKGMPGEFDFDMMKKAQSPDRPLFVNDKELAKAVVVGTTVVGRPDNEGAMDATSQPTVSGEEPPMDAEPSGDAAMDTEPPSDAPMDEPQSSDSAMGDESSSEMEGASEEGEMDESSGPSTPAWGILGGFAVLNAIIIAYAAGLKRGRARAKSEGS